MTVASLRRIASALLAFPPFCGSSRPRRAASRGHARSQNTNPSRSTTGPTTTGTGRTNPGPLNTNVWNSPFSPHGSAPLGQIVQQLGIERAPRERRGDLRRVHTHEHGLESAGDELTR